MPDNKALLTSAMIQFANQHNKDESHSNWDASIWLCGFCLGLLCSLNEPGLATSLLDTVEQEQLSIIRELGNEPSIAGFAEQKEMDRNLVQRFIAMVEKHRAQTTEVES